MKRLLYALGGLAVLGLAGGLVLSAMLGPAVKAAVEAVGPQVAGVPTTLRSFSVSPLRGSVRLRGLVVGNPPGYKTPSALEFGDVRVRVRLRSLFSDTVVVERVLVRGAVATYELGPGGSNVGVIQRKAEAFVGGGGAPAPKGGKSAKKLLIKDFRFEGGRARLSAAILGGNSLEADIPDLHLKNIGGDSGTSPARAGAELLKAVTGGVAKAGLGLGKDLGAAAGGAVKAAGKAFSGLKGLFK